MAGIGGVIHDENSIWITSFSYSLDNTTNIHVELVIIHPSFFNGDFEDMKIKVEPDSFEVVNLIKFSNITTHQYDIIIKDIRNILRSKTDYVQLFSHLTGI